ncbi:hypothetical protein [Ralstonia phage RP31]|uniref:Uncharacterized protein n=2 Tax=Ripduovirus RP12 TaxID=2560700 RepID=A0A1L7N137_9CAUD|nr:hypothetical protein FDH28_gp203 [Ralstonia phage RP12]BAW19192.1 hypothetical protein [Ralstonia phage RP12]BAW19478.1 hypothetical protein [Ralstonia phage RP31]
MSTRKEHLAKLNKMKALIELSIEGAKVFFKGNTLGVQLPDGSFAQARYGRPVKLHHTDGRVTEVLVKEERDGTSSVELPAGHDVASIEYDYQPEPVPVQDDPEPPKRSRNNRSRRWWEESPWQRGR